MRCAGLPIRSTMRPMPERLEELLDFAAVPAGSLVLDVGCGRGSLSLALARRGCSVVGVDPSAPTPAVARFIRGRLEEIPVRSGAFDAAFSRGTFHRSADPESMLSEMVRAVRPGGLLVIQDLLAPDRERAGLLTGEELCAHFAGERLEVVANRVDSEGPRRIATWLLRAPLPEKEIRRTYIQEDR